MEFDKLTQPFNTQYPKHTSVLWYRVSPGMSSTLHNEFITTFIWHVYAQTRRCEIFAWFNFWTNLPNHFSIYLLWSRSHYASQYACKQLTTWRLDNTIFNSIQEFTMVSYVTTVFRVELHLNQNSICTFFFFVQDEFVK